MFRKPLDYGYRTIVYLVRIQADKRWSYRVVKNTNTARSLQIHTVSANITAAIDLVNTLSRLIKQRKPQKIGLTLCLF